LGDRTNMLTAALNGMGEPWFMALALILTTFLFEDIAIAAGVSLATQGALTWSESFIAVAFGIAIGDLLLYGVGVLARRVPWLEKRYIKSDSSTALAGRLHNHLFSAVLLARVIPGLRLLSYTACGFTRAPLTPFTLFVCLAVVLWTGGLFCLSAAAGDALAAFLGIPTSIAVTLPILLFAVAIPLLNRLRKFFKDEKRING